MRAEQAKILLRGGQPLTDLTIKGLLSVNCEEFIHPVVLNRLRLEAQFRGSFFKAGFKASCCVFSNSVSFAEGGHNHNGPFVLEGCTFEGFVDFWDCLFTGPVEIVGCTFAAGTNLLGHEWADGQFEVEPQIRGNHGRLDLFP